MKNNRGKKKKTPSREKYEKENPVVGFRISRELYDRLQSVKKAEGKSITEVLKVGVGLLEVKVRKEKEIRVQAYDEGWEKGASEAEELYSVSYSCSVCGEEIVVTTDEEKRAIKKYMREHGWGHANCINRR
jgi:predicted CopG family antitoxin